jgi:hypothetical protein
MHRNVVHNATTILVFFPNMEARPRAVEIIRKRITEIGMPHSAYIDTPTVEMSTFMLFVS